MAKSVLKNVGILFAGAEIGTDMNSVALEYGADTPEKTCFGNDTHLMAAGGLKLVTLGGSGYFNAANADPALFGKVALADQLVTLLPERSTVGGVAYFFQSVLGQYTPLQASLGEMAGFTINAGAGGAPFVRGALLHKAAAEGATDDGAAVQQGAVSGSQFLYAGLHVFSVGGGSPTLDVKVQSDDNAGFTTPTDRITFSQATAVGAQWATPVAGAITDDYWRATFTIGGSSPEFGFAVVMGIL